MPSDGQFYLWPIAVFEDRYGGVYSGGKWVAIGRADLDRRRDKIVADHWSGDFECGELWTDGMKALTGQGDTPDAAVSDLKNKALAMGEITWNIEWLSGDD